MADPAIELAQVDGGKVRIHVRRWTASGSPRGSIVVLHGIQSHSGWYQHSCARLSEAGFDVWAPDRRGSGLNEDNRGDAPSFRRLLDDVAELMARTAPPRFLAGISWGGKLAVALQRRHPKLTDGLILIAPGLSQRVGFSRVDRFQIGVSRFVSPQKRFAIPLDDPSLFTGNPDRQSWIQNDPLTLRTATARLLFESARLDIYDRWASRHVIAPTLVLLAERDRIVDNAATRRILARFASKDVTVQEYAGAHHTLEFEADGPPFLGDLIDWLGQHARNKMG